MPVTTPGNSWVSALRSPRSDSSHWSSKKPVVPIKSDGTPLSPWCVRRRNAPKQWTRRRARTRPREKRSGGRVGRLGRAGREGSLLDKISNEVLEASGSRRYEEKSAQWKELTPDEEAARTHPRNGEIEISPKRRWRSNCDEVPDGRFSGDKTCLTNTSTSSQGRSSRSWLA